MDNSTGSQRSSDSQLRLFVTVVTLRVLNKTGSIKYASEDTLINLTPRLVNQILAGLHYLQDRAWSSGCGRQSAHGSDRFHATDCSLTGESARSGRPTHGLSEPKAGAEAGHATDVVRELQTPSKKWDLLQTYTPSRSLRSSSAGLLALPDIKLSTVGARAFSHAAPKLWNSLLPPSAHWTPLHNSKLLLKPNLPPLTASTVVFFNC
ncbi:uncharacterized protein LOC118282716 isoform X2 [Scophthalmus maximus]|uniref:uncharacterized protein LOC118282716 isoform X2 n=1 Tax=Scophthalmus maximus TaxID=52904 RepID=UPI001FA82B51|nr:uncharacterized protein LOC118282716 isoform X2 [Scophthalmus maximus]